MRTLARTMLGRVRRRTERSEQGDTLIELLIAIVIIALTVTALLGALVTSLTSSATQKSLSTVDAVLNSFAQSAQYEAQQAFVNCTPTPYRLVSAPMPAAGPVGASVVVFVTGFADSTGLVVTLTPVGGGGSVTPTITSGQTTTATGNATVTFTVPGSVTGAQNVSVSDGTSTPSPTPFVVGGTNQRDGPCRVFHLREPGAAVGRPGLELGCRHDRDVPQQRRPAAHRVRPGAQRRVGNLELRRPARRYHDRPRRVG